MLLVSDDSQMYDMVFVIFNISHSLFELLGCV